MSKYWQHTTFNFYQGNIKITFECFDSRAKVTAIQISKGEFSKSCVFFFFDIILLLLWSDLHTLTKKIFDCQKLHDQNLLFYQQTKKWYLSCYKIVSSEWLIQLKHTWQLWYHIFVYAYPDYGVNWKKKSRVHIDFSNTTYFHYLE